MYKVICSIIGLILCFLGTLISVFLVVTISVKRILKLSTIGYLASGHSRDAVSQKYFGIFGLSILLLGTIFQIAGTLQAIDDNIFCILVISGTLFVVIVGFICWLRNKRECCQIDKVLNANTK